MHASWKRALKDAALMFLVICIGTIFDWFAHQTSPRFDVPEYYFRNKIIFGTIIGFLAIQVLRRKIQSDAWLAFGTTLTVAVLLQVRYYLEGYDPFFVFLFLGIHFVAFFVPALVLFRSFQVARAQ